MQQPTAASETPSCCQQHPAPICAAALAPTLAAPVTVAPLATAAANASETRPTSAMFVTHHRQYANVCPSAAVMG